MTAIFAIAAGVFLGIAAFAVIVILILACLKSEGVNEGIVIHIPDVPYHPSFAGRNTLGSRLMKRWSRLHDRCIDCGGTDSPHHAHGRCRRCNAKVKWQERKKLYPSPK